MILDALLRLARRARLVPTPAVQTRVEAALIRAGCAPTTRYRVSGRPRCTACTEGFYVGSYTSGAVRVRHMPDTEAGMSWSDREARDRAALERYAAALNEAGLPCRILGNSVEMQELEEV